MRSFQVSERRDNEDRQLGKVGGGGWEKELHMSSTFFSEKGIKSSAVRDEGSGEGGMRRMLKWFAMVRGGCFKLRVKDGRSSRRDRGRE